MKGVLSEEKKKCWICEKKGVYVLLPCCIRVPPQSFCSRKLSWCARVRAADVSCSLQRWNVSLSLSVVFAAVVIAAAVAASVTAYFALVVSFVILPLLYMLVVFGGGGGAVAVTVADSIAVVCLSAVVTVVLVVTTVDV